MKSCNQFAAFSSGFPPCEKVITNSEQHQKYQLKAFSKAQRQLPPKANTAFFAVKSLSNCFTTLRKRYWVRIFLQNCKGFSNLDGPQKSVAFEIETLWSLWLSTRDSHSVQLLFKGIALLFPWWFFSYFGHGVNDMYINM